MDLTIIKGRPGSGKSHFAQAIARSSHNSKTYNGLLSGAADSVSNMLVPQLRGCRVVVYDMEDGDWDGNVRETAHACRDAGVGHVVLVGPPKHVIEAFVSRASFVVKVKTKGVTKNDTYRGVGSLKAVG